MRRTLFALTIIAFLTIITLGCNDFNESRLQRLELYSKEENNETPNEEAFKDLLMSRDVIEANKSVDHINSNKVENFHSSSSIREETISEDQEIIEGIVYDLPEVEPGTVIIIGDHAWVNIMFREKLSGAEQEKIVQNIEKQLQEAIPRYEYEIIVNDYMHTD